MKARIFFLSASLVWLLTACGGGGGGSANPQDSAIPSSAQTANNISNAAGESLSVGDLILGLAKVEVGAAQTALASTGASTAGACSNSDGSAQITWTDLNGDALRGVGDLITVQYANCAVPQTGSVLTGTIVLKIESASDGALRLTADHGAGLLLVDQKDQTPSHVLGSITISWSDDGMTRQISVNSSSNDDLRLTSKNSEESAGPTYAEHLHAIDIHNALSREHARSNTRLAFKLVSEFLKDTFVVSTPVEMSSYFDTFPDSGEVDIRSSSNALARIKTSYLSDTSKLSYEADTNGDGTSDDSGYASWSDITTGVMWWADELGSQSTFTQGSTQPASSSSFAILKSTVQPVPRRVRIVVASIELNNERAAMKDFSGSIRTSIQRQSGSQVVAA